ncbi:MAG: VOC family protein [Maribacter sp.]
MKIEHLAIWVKDLDGMKNFYETFFGATSGNKYNNETKKFTSYFLSFKDGPRLELMHSPEIDDKLLKNEEQMGLSHFAISVGSKKKVDELTKTLKDSGFSIIGNPRTTGDGYYESVVLDPEQNRLEITV